MAGRKRDNHYGNSMETTVYFVNHLEEKLVGTLHQPEFFSRYGILLGHCFSCTRHTGILREISARLTTAGFQVLRFDFSGNGQSEGEFVETSYSKSIAEMGIAATFLRSFGVEWLGVAGHSMGAAISVLAARELKGIQAVCAIAGRLASNSPPRFFSEAQYQQLQETGRLEFVSRGRQLELDQRFLMDMQTYNLPDAVASLDVPLLIVHGDQDAMVPVEQAVKAHDSRPDSDLLIIPEADHFFSQTEHREMAANHITEWFVGKRGKGL